MSSVAIRDLSRDLPYPPHLYLLIFLFFLSVHILVPFVLPVWLSDISNSACLVFILFFYPLYPSHPYPHSLPSFAFPSLFHVFMLVHLIKLAFFLPSDLSSFHVLYSTLSLFFSPLFSAIFSAFLHFSRCLLLLFHLLYLLEVGSSFSKLFL